MKIYEAQVNARKLFSNPELLERVTEVEADTGRPWMVVCHFYGSSVEEALKGMVRVQYTNPLNGSKWAEAEVSAGLLEQVEEWVR